MEYKTLASIHLALRSKEINVSVNLTGLGLKLEVSHTKGQKRVRGNKEAYYDNYACVCLHEKAVIDVGDAILSLCNNLFEIECLLNEIIETGGKGWLKINLYDPDFIQVILDNKVIKRLNELGLEIAILNRTPSRIDE